MAGFIANAISERQKAQARTQQLEAKAQLAWAKENAKMATANAREKARQEQREAREREIAEGRAAARSARSTWCVTVTDRQGHAIGHGCARPAPARTVKRDKPGTPDRPDPPGRPSFTFSPTDQPGPPGGYGTWRFSTGMPGQRDLLLEIEPIPPSGRQYVTEPTRYPV